MTEHSSPSINRSPWRRAMREARAVALVSIVVAVTYNLFAVTSIPWLREVKVKDSTAADPLDSILGTSPALTDNPNIGAPIDTAVTVDTATVPTDTAATGLTQRQLDSIAQWRKDSVKLARAESGRMRDSLAKAEAAALVEKLMASDVVDINTDVAKKLFDARLAKFIDARPEDQYNTEHISGAMNVYAEQWQSQIPEIIKLPRDQVLICYCGGGDECELSHDLAKSLKGIGFTKVFVYTGGITDWNAKKLPVTKK